MKIYSLFLLRMFFCVNFVSGMELSPQISWNNFPNKVIMRIAGSLENKRALFCVDKRLATFVTISLADAVNNKNYVVAEFLLQKGAAVNAWDKVWRQTPLIRAIETDQYDMMQLLLDYKADPNAVDSVGYAPLHVAARKYNCAAATLLLDKGALVDVKNYSAYTPLISSVRSNNMSVLAQGVKKKGTNIGSTFASFAMAELLLSAGADPNPVDFFEATALNSAVSCENIAMIDLLLHNGANPHIKNRQGNNAYTLTHNYDILPRLDKSRPVKKIGNA